MKDSELLYQRINSSLNDSSTKQAYSFGRAARFKLNEKNQVTVSSSPITPKSVLFSFLTNLLFSTFFKNIFLLNLTTKKKVLKKCQ
jgi:hypothetical protein